MSPSSLVSLFSSCPVPPPSSLSHLAFPFSSSGYSPRTVSLVLSHPFRPFRTAFRARRSLPPLRSGPFVVRLGRNARSLPSPRSRPAAASLSGAQTVRKLRTACTGSIATGCSSAPGCGSSAASARPSSIRHRCRLARTLSGRLLAARTRLDRPLAAGPARRRPLGTARRPSSTRRPRRAGRADPAPANRRRRDRTPSRRARLGPGASSATSHSPCRRRRRRIVPPLGRSSCCRRRSCASRASHEMKRAGMGEKRTRGWSGPSGCAVRGRRCAGRPTSCAACRRTAGRKRTSVSVTEPQKREKERDAPARSRRGCGGRRRGRCPS